MANTTYKEVVDSFESTFQNKKALPEGIVEQWFKDSLGDFSLEIEELEYDYTLNEFTRKLKQWEISTLGLMMKVKYLTRELSRVNKLNNIIGKDLSFNATGDTKKYTKEELELELSNLNQKLEMQKPSAYV